MNIDQTTIDGETPIFAELIRDSRHAGVLEFLTSYKPSRPPVIRAVVPVEPISDRLAGLIAGARAAAQSPAA